MAQFSRHGATQARDVDTPSSRTTLTLPKILAIYRHLFPLCRAELGQVDNALRVAPLVVIPGHHLDHVIAHDHGE
jgi:hypothetical protein